MNGFTTLLHKEVTEIVRTWKIWVLPALFIFLAVTGVISARFTKELMESLMPSGSAVQITLPDPTWRDSLAQWNKNLSQIGLIAVLLTGGGMINAEARHGTHILILTKPVSRWGYVLAKYLSTAVFCVVTVTVATAVEFLIGLFFFPDSELLPLLQLTATWTVFALLLLAVTLIGSAAFDSPLAASGLGLAAMLLISLGSLWGPAAMYSPAGLPSLSASFSLGHGVESLWPIWTALLLLIGAVAVAGSVFSAREL